MAPNVCFISADEPNKGCAECCKSKGHGATNGECKPAMYANKPIPNVSMQCHCLSQVTTEIKTESVTNCNKQCQVNHKRFKGTTNFYLFMKNF